MRGIRGWGHEKVTWVKGVRLFDLSNPVDRAYAVGGYNVRGTPAHHHAGMEGHQ